MKASALRNQLAGITGTLLCVAVQGMQAQTTDVPSTATASTNDHLMIIKVVDAVTAKPLPNTAILLPPRMLPSGQSAVGGAIHVTDASGVVQLALPAALVNAHYFTLSISNASYPPRIATWHSQSAPLRGSLPAEHTLKLERGLAIGGFVRDERGQPLEGVKVVPWGSGSAAYNTPSSSSKAQVQEYGYLARDDERGAITDAKGFWIHENFPPDIESVWLDVVRPGGSHNQFATPGPARNEAAEALELSALRATNALLVLKDGMTVRGIVVDEAGKAVPGARIRERSGGGWNVSAQIITNHADGRFALTHRTAAQYLITAEADGFAIASEVVTLADEAEVRIVLQPAQPRRMRLVNEKGAPVAGAGVSIVDYRNRSHVLDWKSTTDEEGRAVWTNAPGQDVVVLIAVSNYPPRMARLKFDAAEQAVRLRATNETSIELRLHVQDQVSGRPIPTFEVWRDLQWNSAFKSADWSGTNGNFRATLDTKDFPQHSGSVYRLQVRAEGYAAWPSEQIFFDEGDFEATIRLKPAAAPAGIVLQPDGKPAIDAKVMLTSQLNSIFANSPDRYYPNDGVMTQNSGADGSFRFVTAEDDQRLVVTHQTGYASLTIEELRTTGKVPLQAWARVEGVLRMDGKPVARQRIYIKAPVSWEAAEGIRLLFSDTTSADGGFTFTNLPPGDFVLYRMPHNIMNVPQTESHRMIVSLKAGETKQVEYGFGGRMVVGYVEAGGEVDWQNDPHILAVKLPPPPAAPAYLAYADPKAFEKARKARARSAAFLDYERKKQQFQLVFDRDGNFKIDDVPPGQYELRLRATKPSKDPRAYRSQGNEQVLGTLTREITIPPGKPGEEFDLGMLEMEIQESAGPRTPPVDISAVTLDGKPFNLASLRGKPVALIFWAKWAPYSPVRLAELRAAHQALGANHGATFVTVNLDENIETTRAGLTGLDDGWTHTRLTGASRVEVTERLGVDTLPVILLLDAEGRVASRDPGGRRIRTTIERIVKKTARK